MSKLSQAVKRLHALREFITRARQELPKVGPLLDALQADSYAKAWGIFAGYGDVAAVLAKVPAVARPYISVIGPYIMEAVDAYVDEDAIERFLQGFGVLPQEVPT